MDEELGTTGVAEGTVAGTEVVGTWVEVFTGVSEGMIVGVSTGRYVGERETPVVDGVVEGRD